ncbi:HET-domain-containing protein [Gigaspora margarita]|uniref:HET-domain-containing protein n=1 Tax=Gigaspora margarita TaxID=4874 RepID=A0A8H4AQJ1_GIGMA|nr:HET-domain-containing protein [Gigaspora margarita]
MGCFAWLKSLLTHKSDHLRNLEIPSTKSLYTTLEIIPNKLQLFVYSHTISLHELDSDPFQKEKHLESQIACWTFLSHGLSVHGQKEIYFTLRRYEDEDENDIPVNIKDLYHAFYILARKGSRVDIGGYSNFGNEIIFSNTDMNKIIYTEKQKDEIGLPSQVLHAILITNEEYEVYVNYGISRLLARMGYARRYFPFPPWSERLRESVVTMDDMKSSILNIIGSIIQILGVRVTRLRNKTIKLNISPNSHEIIYNVLRETGFNGVLTILTGIDKQANSCLVWNGNHEELNANSSGYLSTRLGGCFITFCSQQPADRVQVAEDGFILFLTDNTFQQIYQALISRNSLNIKPNENVHIVLEWDNEERFSNENYNNEHVADLILLELLTNENRLQDRISLNSQAQYTGKIDNVVKKHFSSMHKSNGFNLSIFFTLKENEPAHIKLQMNPLDYDDSKALSHKLWHSLTLIDLPPICSGLISFQMHYAVWGGESELILEENAKITPELNVWPEKKENNLSTNEITFLHSFRLIGDTEESLIEDKKEKLNLINEKGFVNQLMA